MKFHRSFGRKGGMHLIVLRVASKMMQIAAPVSQFSRQLPGEERDGENWGAILQEAFNEVSNFTLNDLKIVADPKLWKSVLKDVFEKIITA